MCTYCQVLNRTSEEVENNPSTEDLAMKERNFFKVHPELGQLNQKMLGKPELETALVDLQDQRLRKLFPELKSQVCAAACL